MKTGIGVVALFAGAVAVAVAGAADASERATLEAKLRKYSGTAARRGALCVCQNGGQFHAHAGYVGVGYFAPEPGLAAVSASCAIPLFAPDGGVTGYSGCHPFVTLAK